MDQWFLYRIPKAGRAYLKVTYKLLKGTPIVPAGHVLGFDEIFLMNEHAKNQDALKWLRQKNSVNITTDIIEADREVEVTEKDRMIKIAVLIETINAAELGFKIDVTETDAKVILKGKEFLYVYNKKNGLFDSINYAGNEYLDNPMEFNI